MDTTVVLWLFGALISVMSLVLAGICGWIAHHSRDCRDYRVKAAEQAGETRSDLRQVKAELGDRRSGIRGWLHELANDISPYITRKQAEREK